MQSTAMSLLWFVIVLALIPLSLFVLKKTGLARGTMTKSGEKSLKAVAQLSLGQHQRVVTVELGAGAQKTWLVLGVTGQSITLLHTLEPSEESQEQASGDPVSSNFPLLLRRSSDALEAPRS